MDGKIDRSIAETVASDSLAADAPSDISRISSAVAEDEGRFVPGTLWH